MVSPSYLIFANVYYFPPQCLDYKASLPEGLDISQYSSICPAVSLVIELEHRYDALRAADITKEGQCVDHWMLAVSPNYQRRGIAERLVAAASTLAARRGYRYAVLESTGAFSAKCAQKCGMKPVFTQVWIHIFYLNTYTCARACMRMPSIISLELSNYICACNLYIYIYIFVYLYIRCIQSWVANHRCRACPLRTHR